MSDFGVLEWGAALVAVVVVHGGAGYALQAANLDHELAVSEIARDEVPVKVQPVLDLDLPLLKKGGKKAVLPDMWQVKQPKARVEKKTFASTKAEKTVDEIPDDPAPMASAETEAPDEDAEETKKVDTEVDPSDEEEAASTEEGHSDGSEGGTEMDPLKAHAVDQYRAKLAGFFQSGFGGVHGTGLPDEELVKLRVGVTVQLNGLTVGSFTVSPSGNAAMDAAAQAHMQSKVGQQVPPPPENYPDIGQATISLSLRCSANSCS